MAKIILISGHGYNDVGAVKGEYNERDFIREHIVDKVQKYLKLAGHKVDIYGKKQDMYQDTRYGIQVGNYKDYGIYWVKSQGYDIVVEFHLDASNDSSVDGGHVIIAEDLEPDKIDIGLQNAIDKHVDVVHGISYRDDLAHTSIAKQINLNYRLVELGFITNKGDMDYIIKNTDAFCKDIADAINQKEIVVANKKPAVKKKTATKKKKPQAQSKNVYHKVKSGENLTVISKKYKTTIKAIKLLNKMNSDTIYIGQNLLIKKGTVTKQKAPAKVKTSSKTNRTHNEAVKYAIGLIGRGVDYDSKFGWQCFDTANVYWHFLFNHGLKGIGAKDIVDPNWNDFTGEATVYKNTPSFLAKSGDLVVWGNTFGSGYGHVAIVLSATLNNIVVVEQNWLGGGVNMTEKNTKRAHPYDTNMWFVRPNFKA